MSLPVKLHPLAEEDLIKAWSWYEARRRGPGDRFLASVRAAIEMAAEWPNSA